MKKYLIAASLLMALSASAQKDELKALKKLSDKETMPTDKDIQEFKTLLEKAEPLMANATNEQKADFYYYKGGYAFVAMMKNPAAVQQSVSSAIENFNKVIEIEKNEKKKNHTKEIQEEIYPQLKSMVITVAQGLGKQKMYKDASQYYHTAYVMDPKDQSMLYNAAAYAVNGQDYEKALAYYLELDKLGFTGEGTNYSAINVKTGEKEYFPNPKLRETSIQLKQHTNPKDEKLPSLKGDIVKNIALIYVHQGNIEKAKQAMVAARNAHPEDVSLIVSEAELYFKTNDMAMYKKLIAEAAQKNPNNADLFYNLGVLASKNNKDEAIQNYQKALSINPNHVNANTNMGSVLLSDEEKIVNEMNNLGTSAKDNQRYEVLKKQRNDMFKKALPYFEKALQADPENQYAITMCANIYQALEMPDKAKAMKAKLKG